jgi:hypothetical protein
MDRKETFKVLMTINAVYGAKFKYPTGNDLNDTIKEDAWLAFLSVYSFEQVSKAVMFLMRENTEWPPTASKVEELLEMEKHPTVGEAWELACDYTYLKKKKTPAIVIQAVNEVGKDVIGMASDKEKTYVMHQFESVYKAIIKTRNQEKISDRTGFVIGDNKNKAQQIGSAIESLKLPEPDGE